MIEEEGEEEIEFRQDRLHERARLLYGRFKAYIERVATLKNIANTTFILIVSIICLHQCYTQLIEYFKFSTRIQVIHTFPSSTLWLMPGVTICNNNRVRLEKLLEEYPTLYDDVANLKNRYNLSDSLPPEDIQSEYSHKLKKAIDETVNVSSLLKQSSIDKLLDLSRLSMIKDINCNSIWGTEFNCENFRIIESYQAAPCYSLFYLGAILEALATGQAYDFNTSLLGGQQKLNSFSDREILEILIDFEPDQQADFQRDIGGKVIIHSTGHSGSIRDMANSIGPGQSYDLIVQRYMSKRLPPPYKSQCRDYKQLNTPEFTKKQGSYPSVILDRTTCIRNCIVKQTTETCDCWPVEVPFYLGDTLVNESETYKMCAWCNEDDDRNYSPALYINCFKKFHAICRLVCKAGCTTEDYKIRAMSNQWPTREMFYRASSEAERMELERLRRCCAKISVKYLEFMETRHIMYPSMTVAQLISNIGGIASALVGVSAVTIYRYLTRRVLRCKIVSDYYPKKKQVTSRKRLNRDKRLSK